MRSVALFPIVLCACACAANPTPDQNADPTPDPAPASAAAASAPAPCQSAAHRQFDFWLGRWEVEANGQPAGRNRIERRHNGCVLDENWVSAGGSFTGQSINSYDATRQVWHQTWSDSSGTLLLLEGGLRDGAMVLEGSRAGGDGEPVRNRISWTPNPDGTVRQLWQFKSADQSDWQTAFDGLYKRVSD